MQIFLAIVNKNTYICANKKLITMVYHFQKEEWMLLGDMLGALKHLQQQLEEKGFKVICTFTSGVYPAELVFIVERNFTKMFSFVSFDMLAEQDKIKAEVFERADQLLSTDLDAIERDALLKRLAELENKAPANGCGGCR